MYLNSKIVLFRLVFATERKIDKGFIIKDMRWIQFWQKGIKKMTCTLGHSHSRIRSFLHSNKWLLSKVGTKNFQFFQVVKWEKAVDYLFKYIKWKGTWATLILSLWAGRMLECTNLHLAGMGWVQLRILTQKDQGEEILHVISTSSNGGK